MAKKKIISTQIRIVEGDSRWDTTPKGIRISEKPNDFDFIVPGKPRDDYWLVRVTYSTGDSFSTQDGVIADASLCSTRKDADKVRDAIRKRNDYDKEHYSNYSPLRVRLSDREEVISVSPWTGYFENIQDISVYHLDRL